MLYVALLFLKYFAGEGPFCKRVPSPTPPPLKTFSTLWYGMGLLVATCCGRTFFPHVKTEFPSRPATSASACRRFTQSIS
ncbi:hypothetical protein KL86DES1_21448 [uncultured Desulfovibrio sp.]|uniref:Uncharacterized protein n=1 Tax=uncultured Desulfovibrio sp. TaxID=167968 RepID=A0A212L7Z8_9BACT|nr:hypothetical protein KL86DES1_21448 [uncultured Desulfovibrio sp.]VZH34345.1 conserved protein of unknown function [Desulfovibrio sp. 86]